MIPREVALQFLKIGMIGMREEKGCYSYINK